VAKRFGIITAGLLSVFLTFTAAAQTKTAKEKIEPQIAWSGLPSDQKRVLARLRKTGRLSLACSKRDS